MRKIHLMPVACLLAAGAAMAQSALLFKKNGVVKFSITEFGNLTTDAGYYTESAPGSAAAGEFAFRESTVDPGQEMITSANGNLLLKGRIVKMAVTPSGSGHLGFKNPSHARRHPDQGRRSLPDVADEPGRRSHHPRPFFLYDGRLRFQRDPTHFPFPIPHAELRHPAQEHLSLFQLHRQFHLGVRRFQRSAQRDGADPDGFRSISLGPVRAWKP